MGLSLFLAASGHDKSYFLFIVWLSDNTKAECSEYCLQNNNNSIRIMHTPYITESASIFFVKSFHHCREKAFETYGRRYLA